VNVRFPPVIVSVPDGLLTVRPAYVVPVRVCAPVPLKVIVAVPAGVYVPDTEKLPATVTVVPVCCVNVPNTERLPPTVTVAPVCSASVPSVRSPVVVSEPVPLTVSVPVVMLTLCTVTDVDSVGLFGVPDGIVRSSPATGMPCGLQLSAVVHAVDVPPTHV